MTYAQTLGTKAKAAEQYIAAAASKLKNNALQSISDSLIENTEKIIAANKLDLENAIKNGMSASMQDRLMLNESRIKDISSSVLKLIEAEDQFGPSLIEFNALVEMKGHG